jgi:7,8-dihydropterin-6-yl-methyl-4-(beta-D-ribofuranosyl)aminobenzene 5'-phosphate synthase
MTGAQTIGIILSALTGVLSWPAWPPPGTLGPGEAGPIRLTILYDNTAAVNACKAGWGFACLVQGTEKTILFDTGADGPTLLANAQTMGVDLSGVEIAVISHDHGDHTGGLTALPKRAPGLPVLLPAAPTPETADRIRAAGAVAVVPDGPVTLCRNVFLTGRMGDRIAEQALVIRTATGLVVITGCAHPGIIPMLERARALGGQEIDTVVGGFHLLPLGEGQVAEIVAQFRKLGVRRVGPTHCSGDAAKAMFRKEYGPDFLEMGVGRVLEVGAR